MAQKTLATVVWGKSFMLTVASVLKTASVPALVVGGKLRLIKDPAAVIDPTMTIAALATKESAFSGYPAGGFAVTLLGPADMGIQQVGMLFQHTFIRAAGTPDVGEGVVGAWVDDGTNVILGGMFDASVDLSDPLSFLDLLVLFPFPLYVSSS